MIHYRVINLIILLTTNFTGIDAQTKRECPPREAILPCRCLVRSQEYQIWCTHSSLPNVLDALKSLALYISDPIDELILENNFLPSLPGRTFSPLKILRLMMRSNGLERVSSDWLADLESSLMEIFIVELQLTSLPEFALSQMKNIRAVTIHSNSMKRLPIFSGLPTLKYLHIEAKSLVELSPANFKDNPALEKLHIQSSPRLTKLEANLFDDLPKLDLVNITNCGLNWVHPRAMGRLPRLRELSLVGNKFTDAGIVGRASRELPQLEIIRLDHNHVTKLSEATFVDIPSLKNIHLSNNAITEIHRGAFHRLPSLRSLDLNKNLLRRVHPRSFLHPSESVLEEVLLMYNDISDVMELRSLLDGLPRLVFLDMSYNRLRAIPFGALRGHATLEQINLGFNMLHMIDKEAFIAMPALRELKLTNNSVKDVLETPYWNLPALKGLDLAQNLLRKLEPRFLANVGSLRRIDLSKNELNVLHPEVFVPTPFLEHINSSHNNLKILHPVTFRHLTELYELDLSYNYLRTLVQGLPRNIEHLHLFHNEISKISVENLDMPSLRLLDLSFNRIQVIPRGSFRGLGHLRRLYLGSNLLQSLDELSLDGLNQLETLDLSENRLVHLHPGSMRVLTALKILNLANNEVNLLGPNLLIASKNIQNINMSRNQLSEIFPGTLDSCQDIEILDVSNNLLVHLPQALHGRGNLKKLDLTSNRISSINATVLHSLTSLRDLKLSRNFIKLLEENTFTNLKQLKSIDLEDNELEYVEPNSIRMLPVLKSVKLKANKIASLPNMAFNNLPSLQSIELQQNKLRKIESQAFNLVPHLLLVNLSRNELASTEDLGLAGLSSVELLDLSFNKISRLTSANLKELEWLVELRVDNNDICEVGEGVFDNMLRLKALSLENNRIAYIPEMAAQRLRSNIANIAIKGNPLLCNCNIRWLQAWLKESSQDGPRCADGTPLREMRLATQDCTDADRSKKIAIECEAENLDSPSRYATSQILSSSRYTLKNSSQSIIKGNSGNDNSLAPLPEDSDYFYDDYIDYPYSSNSSNPASGGKKEKTPDYNTTGNTPTLYAASTKSKPSIPPNVSYSPSTSGFTFFGLPIPSFNVSSLFGGKKATPARSPPLMERKSAIVNDPPKGKRISIAQIDMLQPPSVPELQSGFRPILPGYGGFKPIPDPNLSTPRPVVKTEIKRVVKERTELVSNKSTVLHFNNSSASNRSKKSQQVPGELSKTAFHLQSIANVKISNLTETQGFVGPNRNRTEEKRVVAFVNRTEGNSIADQSVHKPVYFPTTPQSVQKTTTIPPEPSTLPELKIEQYDTTTSISVTTKKPEIVTSVTKPVEDQNYTIRKENANFPMPTRNTTETEPAINKKNVTGSVLSALLVPGGQQLHFKPSAKSTITKVASPHESGSASLLSSLEVADVIDLPSDVKVKVEQEDILVVSTATSVGKDVDGWYFENYNRVSLEPFVAKIVNKGSYRIVHKSLLIVIVVAYSVLN